MQKRLAVLTTLLCATGLTIVACGRDSSTAPAPTTPVVATPSRNLLGLPISLPIVQRLLPLNTNHSWSFVVTPNGGQHFDLLTGLDIIVPRGAVSQTTTITVTAESGAAVAYEFQPEGLHFATPITLVQNLELTSLIQSLLGAHPVGAYYATPTLQFDSGTGTAVVNELEPTTTNLLLLQTSIKVSHFSGYTLASANSIY